MGYPNSAIPLYSYLPAWLAEREEKRLRHDLMAIGAKIIHLRMMWHSSLPVIMKHSRLLSKVGK